MIFPLLSRWIKFTKWLVIGLFLIIYMVGWESIDYAEDDPNIGREVYLSDNFVQLENISDKIAGGAIDKKYGKVLMTKTFWDYVSYSYPSVKVRQVYCDERFVVTNSFTLTKHGLINQTGGTIELEYYVLSSNDRGNLPILRSEFKSHTSNSSILGHNCESELSPS